MGFEALLSHLIPLSPQKPRVRRVERIYEMKSKTPELLGRIRNSGEDVLGFFVELITRKESAKNKSLKGKGQKERL